MKTRLFVLTLVVSLLSASFACGQTIEKIVFDAADTAENYYLAIQPQSKKNKGALILLTSFIRAEDILAETKLHNVAYTNDILMVVLYTKQKLYADGPTLSLVNGILKDVTKRFSVNPSKFAIAGFDEAGNIALRFTEFAHEFPEQFPIQPKAVFAVDSHVDLFGFWHWSENQIKKNYWQGSVGDSQYYIDTMTKEQGSIYDNASRYRILTPFDRERLEPGNEKYLQNVAVRLYYDTDIEWQLKNRRNSLYDTKMPDGSELINRLLLAGNDKAEFISAKQPGLKNSGVRHPNTLSIVDAVDCIHWIKRILGIFDHETWVSPYYIMSPAGWQQERFELPADFASAMTYSGVEEIRFAPGWGIIESEEHWAYCFLWWLDGTPKIDAEILQKNLTVYYEGLVGGNIVRRKIPADKVVPVKVVLKKTKRSEAGDRETYTGTISMLDYHEQKPIVLNCLVHVRDIQSKGHTTVYIELSPRPVTHPVWKKMDEIGQSIRMND